MAPDHRLLMLLLRRIRPWHFAAIIGIFLLVSWTCVLLIDVLNFAGLRDAMVRAANLEQPILWWQIFRDGGPAEWLQWLCLGLAAVLMAAAGGRELRERPMLAMFWLILALGMMLMLIEDAGNPRHAIRHIVFTATGSDGLSRAVEFGCFALLAGLPLLALLRFGSHIWPFRQTRTLVIAAYVIYAIVGLSNATRHWGEWHAAVGEGLRTLLALELNVDTHHRPDLPPGFWLMDTLIEESLELLGAATFLTAILTFWKEAPEESAIEGMRHEP